MAKLVIRQPYVEFDDPSVIVDFGPSLTHQSFADECNFNAVLARWETTGVIEHVNQTQPQYLDVTAAPLLGRPFSRSYGSILPSSLAMNHSSA